MKTKLSLTGTMIMVWLLVQLSLPAKCETAWKFSKSTDNVDLYYSIQKCDGNDVVLFKFVNHEKKNVKLSWTEVMKTQFGSGQKSFRGPQTLEIAPGVTMGKDCSDRSIPQCVLRSTDGLAPYIPVISQFDFENVTVVK